MWSLSPQWLLLHVYLSHNLWPEELSTLGHAGAAVVVEAAVVAEAAVAVGAAVVAAESFQLNHCVGLGSETYQKQLLKLMLCWWILQIHFDSHSRDTENYSCRDWLVDLQSVRVCSHLYGWLWWGRVEGQMLCLQVLGLECLMLAQWNAGLKHNPFHQKQLCK